MSTADSLNLEPEACDGILALLDDTEPDNGLAALLGDIDHTQSSSANDLAELLNDLNDGDDDDPASDADIWGGPQRARPKQKLHGMGKRRRCAAKNQGGTAFALGPEMYLDGTLRDDVMEVFSVRRLLKFTQQLDIRGELSLDLKNGYDFTRQEACSRCWRLIESRRPRFIMSSAPCTMYSALQRMWNLKKMHPEKRQRKQLEADTLFDFGLKICDHQTRTDNHFGHEHPAGANSWTRFTTMALESKKGVKKATFDMCRYGLCSPLYQRPIRKRKSLLSNRSAVIDAFHQRYCQCLGPHRTIQGHEGGCRLSTFCQEYTDMFCVSLANAIKHELVSVQ